MPQVDKNADPNAVARNVESSGGATFSVTLGGKPPKTRGPRGGQTSDQAAEASESGPSADEQGASRPPKQGKSHLLVVAWLFLLFSAEAGVR